MKFVRTFLVGTFCWPMEALFAMWGCALLAHEGFGVPRPGYVSSFVVVVGGEMLLASITLTRECRKEIEKREVAP